MPTLQLSRGKSYIGQLKIYNDITNLSLAMLSVKLITYTIVAEEHLFLAVLAQSVKQLANIWATDFFLSLPHRNQAGSAEQ
jgi:hypothetical protein